MITEDLPDDLKGPLIQLWRMEQPILVSLKPRDAWLVLGIVQFASCNPALSPAQRQLIEAFGRAIQERLAEFDPVFARYLELGWDPAHDQPRKD